MAIQVLINGIDRSDLVEWQSLNWKQGMTSKADTFDFSLKKYGSRTYVPDSFEEVELYKDSEKLFGGVILRVTERVEAVTKVLYDVTCKDYTHILDRHLVIERYDEKPALNIICDILNRYGNLGSRIEIATFEKEEIWIGGAIDSTNYRVGDRGRKLTSTNTTPASMYRDILVDLDPTGYTNDDTIEIDVYVDSVANLDTCVMTLGDATLTNYFSESIESQITADGWNLVKVVKSDFSTTGTIAWENIARIKLEVVSQASSTVEVTFDNWHELKESAFKRDFASAATMVVSQISFNYEAASKALQRLAELFAWNWYVDKDKNIHFFAKFQEAAPFALSDDGGNHMYHSLVRKVSGDQIRNSVFVRGGEYLGDQITEDLNQQADGSNKIFHVGFRYADYSLEVNGLATPVGVDNLQSYAGNNGVSQSGKGGTPANMGDVAGRARYAQQVIVTRNGRRATINLRVRKVGSPTDDFQVRIYGDNGSNLPDTGNLLSSLEVRSGSTDITTSFVEYTFTFDEANPGDLNFNPGDLYHIVIDRSTGVNASNYYQIDAVTAGNYDGLPHHYNGSSWVASTANIYFAETLDYDVLYSFNEKILTFAVAPGAMDTIEWFGKPYRAVLTNRTDPNSINDFGTYESRVLDKSIKSRLAGRQRANEELMTYAMELQDITYQTYQDGLVVGQTQNIQSTIRDFNVDVVINNVTAVCHTPDRLIYSVTGVLTKTMGIIYWLQEQINKDSENIEIADNEVLDRINNLNETLLVGAEYDITVLVGKVWSNDAGTTPNANQWDGGSSNYWM